MKKLALVALAAVGLGLGLGQVLARRPEAATPTLTKTAHALFLGQPGGPGSYDSDVRCGGEGPFIVYVHMTAAAAAASGHVRFRDGDVYGFTLAANQSFSTVQAAGSVPGVDGLIVVVPDSGTLSGWMSASSLSPSRPGGGGVFCTTTP